MSVLDQIRKLQDCQFWIAPALGEDSEGYRDLLVALCSAPGPIAYAIGLQELGYKANFHKVVDYHVTEDPNPPIEMPEGGFDVWGNWLGDEPLPTINDYIPFDPVVEVARTDRAQQSFATVANHVHNMSNENLRQYLHGYYINGHTLIVVATYHTESSQHIIDGLLTTHPRWVVFD